MLHTCPWGVGGKIRRNCFLVNVANEIPPPGDWQGRMEVSRNAHPQPCGWEEEGSGVTRKAQRMVKAVSCHQAQ